MNGKRVGDDRSGRRRKRLLGAPLLVVLLSAFPVLGATTPSPPAAASPTLTEAEAGLRHRLETLELLERTIEEYERAVEELRSALERAESEAERQDLETRLREQEEKLFRYRKQFREAASGVSEEEIARATPPKPDWSAEINELLSPLLNEIKRLTSRPREMHRLARELEFLEEKLAEVEHGLEQARALAARAEGTLRAHLDALAESLAAEAERLRAERDLVRQRLERLRAEQASPYENVRNLVRIFFRSRGRNLLLAVLAFATFWFLSRWFYLRLQRWGPFARRDRTLAARLFELVYIVFAATGGIAAMLWVLYAVGDWVLLSLVVLFLAGLAWASKTALPRFWQQATILLNLGPVREGERLLFEGVPYLVEKLGWQTYVVNPELKGGRLRLPLAHLADLRSRPFDETEIWFPTREGDWVLLDQERLGQVVEQTPERVTVVLLGGAVRSYPTSAFVAESPTVLSRGFRIRVLFGIDYQHQKSSTEEIPRTLREHLTIGLAAHPAGPHLRRLAVEFAQAGASSLDLAVLADFGGEAARYYDELERRIQKLCVDACNENGWVIPFTQVTMHMATPVEVEGLVPAGR